MFLRADKGTGFHLEIWHPLPAWLVDVMIILFCKTISDWRDHLMVDDYSGYKALFTPDGTTDACVELGCLAHERRKFFDLHKANQSPMALAALNRIAVLYAIEAEGKALSIEERKCLRAEKVCRN